MTFFTPEKQSAIEADLEALLAKHGITKAFLQAIHPNGEIFSFPVELTPYELVGICYFTANAQFHAHLSRPKFIIPSGRDVKECVSITSP